LECRTTEGHAVIIIIIILFYVPAGPAINWHSHSREISEASVATKIARGEDTKIDRDGGGLAGPREINSTLEAGSGTTFRRAASSL